MANSLTITFADIPAILAHCDSLIVAYDEDLAIIERALWIMRPLGEEMQTVFRFVRKDDVIGEMVAS